MREAGTVEPTPGSAMAVHSGLRHLGREWNLTRLETPPSMSQFWGWFSFLLVAYLLLCIPNDVYFLTLFSSSSWYWFIYLSFFISCILSFNFSFVFFRFLFSNCAFWGCHLVFLCFLFSFVLFYGYLYLIFLCNYDSSFYFCLSCLLPWLFLPFHHSPSIHICFSSRILLLGIRLIPLWGRDQAYQGWLLQPTFQGLRHCRAPGSEQRYHAHTTNEEFLGYV